MRASETINHEITVLTVDLEDKERELENLQLEVSVLRRRISDLYQARDMVKLGEDTLDIQTDAKPRICDDCGRPVLDHMAGCPSTPEY
jgi:hypothetical protein